MNIMTVVKYKLKSGFEDEFIKAINAYNYSNSILMRLVSIGNEEYLSIMEYDEIDKFCKNIKMSLMNQNKKISKTFSKET